MSTLQSGVPSSPADQLFADAIAATLRAEPQERADLFERLAREIEAAMATHARPWSCRVFAGTDGSRIFRGGIGTSLVIDRAGNLWRARNYEDFDTTYTITPKTCEIESLTPRYAEMRQYVLQSNGVAAWK